MKGLVFKELISLIEDKFGDELADEILDSIDLESGGSYTSVGTYDHSEILAIVTLLSQKTGVGARDLVKTFGKHLLEVFYKSHPDYFQGHTAQSFLSSVDNYIHVEVKKLYPKADLPKILFEDQEDGIVIEYKSSKPFADLAEGLIEKTFEHFNENVNIETSDVEIKTERRFSIKKAS